MDQVKAVCWDLGGTLFPSKALIHNALGLVLPDFGIKPPALEDLPSGFTGRQSELLAFYSRCHPSQAAILRAFEIAIRECYEEAPLYEGAEEVVEQLSAAGLQQALVTRRPKKANQFDDAEQVLGSRGLGKHISVYVTASDITQPKPHPESLYVAAERLGLATAEIVVVGDQTVDMKMARTAGAWAIGVNHDNPPSFSETLIQAGAHTVTESLLALLAIIRP